jgi:hypothetical protein
MHLARQKELMQGLAGMPGLDEVRGGMNGNARGFLLNLPPLSDSPTSPFFANSRLPFAVAKTAA